MSAYSENARSYILITAMLAVVFFQISMQFRHSDIHHSESHSSSNVVISSPILILMYAGDRFLAANFEAIRTAAMGSSDEEGLNSFRIRSHTNISMLNACHEDNTYLSNAMLSWSGTVDNANTILQRATECRFWDDIPPFFLGFNQYFFNKDIQSAQNSLNLAASRSKTNSSNLKKISIMMATKSLNDLNMAISYLRTEHDRTKDNKLKVMLNRRLGRLAGLQILREAQTRYENKFGHSLENPDHLLSSKILDNYPSDPTGIGFEFNDGTFVLRGLKIQGLEK